MTEPKPLTREEREDFMASATTADPSGLLRNARRLEFTVQALEADLAAARDEAMTLRAEVARLKTGCEFVRTLAVEFSVPRLRYVTLQADVRDFNEARAIIGLPPFEFPSSTTPRTIPEDK